MRGSSVRWFVALVALLVLVAVGTSTAVARDARPEATAACAKKARIGGKIVCLRVGMTCKAAYNGIYKKHGFACIAGHLRKTTTATPPAPAPYSPPTGPVGTANTTVVVGLHDDTTGNFGHIELSQTSIPSGMVTFVITNYCISRCSFDLQGIKAGRIFDSAGQSETWTVALAPGVYRYHCDIDPSGMKGTFTVTA